MRAVSILANITDKEKSSIMVTASQQPHIGGGNGSSMIKQPELQPES